MYVCVCVSICLYLYMYMCMIISGMNTISNINPACGAHIFPYG